MSDKELQKYEHMWDGSEDWGLSAHFHSETEIEIEFEGERACIREIMAIRQLLENFRNIPVSEIKKRVGNKKNLRLGVVTSFEFHQLRGPAQALGMNLRGKDVSYTGYLPINQTNQSALIIEDDGEARAVCQKMLDAGVPVVMHVEYD